MHGHQHKPPPLTRFEEEALQHLQNIYRVLKAILSAQKDRPSDDIREAGQMIVRVGAPTKE